jgi:hypothetical protein
VDWESDKMQNNEVHYKDWRIGVLSRENGWKALIFRPHSPLHEPTVPSGEDRHTVIEDAKKLIDGWQTS